MCVYRSSVCGKGPQKTPVRKHKQSNWDGRASSAVSPIASLPSFGAVWRRCGEMRLFQFWLRKCAGWSAVSDVCSVPFTTPINGQCINEAQIMSVHAGMNHFVYCNMDGQVFALGCNAYNQVMFGTASKFNVHFICWLTVGNRRSVDIQVTCRSVGTRRRLLR